MNHHRACPEVRTQAAMRWLGTLAPLAVLTAGCVFVVPVPTAYHPPGSRRNLTDETTTRFTPGTTTVEDVVLALGEPDKAASDASQLTYLWERVNMHLVWGWAIPFGQSAVGQGWEKTYSRAHSLNFAFDESGVLQNLDGTNAAIQITRP